MPPDPGRTVGYAAPAALVLGFMMTLTARGYHFGESNHTVYLLAAWKGQHPEWWVNDWWVNSTFQQHGVFTLLARGLLAIHPLALNGGFWAGYLILALALQAIWFRITHLFGGTWKAYLLSVTLYYLSAGGYALGFYEFLQDGSFLPSNVANVAMLAGFLAWTTNRKAYAGGALGIAGLFHLNHAIAAMFLWTILSVWPTRAWELRPGFVVVPERRFDRSWAIGSAIVVALCLLNVVPALRVILQRQGGLPLEEFVALYVRIRHPHHYDPSTWPVAFWLSFIWPAPLALLTWTKLAPDWRRQSFAREWLRILAVLSALIVVAIIGAGIWYLSEALVQLSLYRFGIYLKLLTCIGAAIWWTDPRRSPRWRKAGIAFVVAALLALAVVSFAPRSEVIDLVRLNRAPLAWILLLSLAPLLPAEWKAARNGNAILAIVALSIITTAILTVRDWDGLRFTTPSRDDEQYLALCRWAEHNTPIGAIFLVPPDEESFRLHARRAIVVNFKGVSQLSGELTGWRERLESVLDAKLETLPRRFDRAVARIGALYDAVPVEHLLEVAKVYDASYVVLRRPAGSSPRLELVCTRGEFRLYRIVTSG